MKNCLAVIGVLFLSGCQEVPFFADQCKAEIRKNMINPETVEFFEISSASLAVFDEAVYQQVKQEMMEKLDWSERSKQEYDIQSDARSISAELSKKYSDASFIRMRVKAEGRLGNKITAHMVCAKQSDSCVCAQEPGVS